MTEIKTLEQVKIENLEKQITKMTEQLDEMQAFVNEWKQKQPKKRWKPKKGQQYFYLDGSSVIHVCLWTDKYEDDLKYLLNNIFRTENDAIESQKKIKFQARFKNFVEERNEELDWTDIKQKKYFLYYDYPIYELGCDYNNSHKHQGTIYASSEQILKDAIAEIGEENIKKYVLEVEE